MGYTVVMKKIFRLVFLSAFFVSGFVLTSCLGRPYRPDTFLIWTDCKELVSYTELYNTIHGKSKAVVVYKEHLASSLPPAKDEEKPDLVVGSWLKNSQTRRLFRPLDKLLSEDNIDSSTFYSPLLKYGVLAGKQYLLPVSFNLPLFIFSSKNEDKIPDPYSLSVEQVKEIAGEFNAQNKKGLYTRMGFAPSWDDEFLYEVTKIFGPCFKIKGNELTWDSEKLEKAVSYIKEWTKQKNTDSTAEQDFQFKYLYTPKYRQIAAERTLFAYTTSSSLFRVSSEQLGDISFRWLSGNGNIPVKDDIVCLALYHSTKNARQAEAFVKWFFQEQNQKSMLERSAKMKLDTATFGIASGFSAIKGVNEHLFPTYYTNLLGNLPAEDKLEAPQAFSERWQSLKERVVFPYLNGVIKTDGGEKTESLEKLLNTWSKQFE